MEYCGEFLSAVRHTSESQAIFVFRRMARHEQCKQISQVTRTFGASRNRGTSTTIASAAVVELAHGSIDPSRFGNVARLVNHSCDPNLTKKEVHTCCNRISALTFA